MTEPHYPGPPVAPNRPIDAGALDAERGRPAMYMVLAQVVSAAEVPAGYVIEVAGASDWPEARALIETDGPVRDDHWSDFMARVLPNGGFLAREARSRRVVGTASASHNPDASRHRFEAGGELGFMVVDPTHRGHGLGRALADAVVARFRAAAYTTVWLGVQGWRLPAVRTYLAAGFRPFLHPPAPDVLEARWQAIYGALGRPWLPSEIERAR